MSEVVLYTGLVVCVMNDDLLLLPRRKRNNSIFMIVSLSVQTVKINSKIVISNAIYAYKYVHLKQNLRSFHFLKPLICAELKLRVNEICNSPVM